MASSSDASRERLISILREREIPLARDDVQWAFDSPATKEDVVRWIDSELHHCTLLTREELDLYSKLQANGLARELDAHNDLAAIVPLAEDQLRTATLELERSTANIDEQIETLKKQHEALKEFQAKSRAETKAQDEAERRQSKRYTSEKLQVAQDTEELEEDLDGKLATAQKGIKTRGESLKGCIAEVLKRNDRNLSSLQHLATRVDLGNLDGGEQKKHVDTLCKKLFRLTAEEILCRLDRIYLEAFDKSRSTRSDNDAHGDAADLEVEISALEEEMSTLYSEIVPVAEMSVRQEFLEPLLQQLHSAGAQSDGDARSTMEYISSTLEYLVQEIDVIVAYSQGHRSFSTAMANIQGLAAEDRPRSPARPGSVRLRRASTKQKSPVRRAKVKDGEMPSEAVIAAQRLLKSHGLNLDPTADLTSIDRTLAASALESKLQLQNLLNRIDSAAETSTADQLGHANKSIELLLDQLFANSPGNDLHMTDQTLEKGLNDIDAKVSEIGATMGNLDLNPSNEDERAKAEFEARWS